MYCRIISRQNAIHRHLVDRDQEERGNGNDHENKFGVESLSL